MIKDCKYNPFLEYHDEIESVIKKKRYPMNIANMLRLSVPVMIEYYGHEYKDIVFDVLESLTIDVAEDSQTIQDVMRKYAFSNIETKSQIRAVKEGELQRASGVHSSNPILEKTEDKKVRLTGKSELIATRESEDVLETLATMVHELSHAFKSHKNSMNLLTDKEGNQILVARSGLAVVYSRVYLEKGKIVIEDMEEKNIGLEEGINTYDENNIMNKILTVPSKDIPSSCQALKDSLVQCQKKTGYASKGYVQETTCATKLLAKRELAQAIRKDQFNGTNYSEAIYNSIAKQEKNTWENLNKKLDLSVRHTYARMENVFNPKWIEEHMNEIVRNLRAIHTMIDECTKKETELEKENS